MPDLARECLESLGHQLQRLKAQILEFDRRINAWHRSSMTSRRLDDLPRVGPALATALVASVPDPKAFRSGRDFSAWIGLVPKQNSSSGKERLDSIIKQGDRYLRSLFCAGALSVIRYAKTHGTKHRPWLAKLLERRPTKLATIPHSQPAFRYAASIIDVARDDRPWGGSDPPAVVYHYAPGRGGEHARTLFAGFNGALQVDGYDGYNGLADTARPGGAITLAYCWSHFRRRFYDLAKGGNAPIASAALDKIGALYGIEAQVRGQSADKRRAVRQERTRPLVDALKTWLGEQLAKLPRSSETAEAIRYDTNHWNGLTCFLGDGRIEIDSNTVERSIRPIALNRKNALFAGSDEGGANWAIVASLIETCKLNGMNPHAWLTDTLTKLVNGWPASKIDDLMPWAYTKIPT